MATTDHERIGHLCLITSFGFFLVAGAPAMFVRAEPTRPGSQLLSHEQYNQAFTTHGTIMLLLFATPAFAGSPTRSCRCRSARPAFDLHRPGLARRDQKETTGPP
ncbi:cbb3-type cytochrome c oxidase subunit I [Streptomyces flaveolus]|uniref:cbb3-type cytochrome c oxidase subunit I n=1 Tax=Streptomyces flaveolus TaxID=67297 RepID=UPI003F4E3167